jgi:hypothetical protein
METVQLPFAASVDPQLLVSAKSPGFEPPTVMLVIESAALPVFVIATVCAGLVEP